ncbi:ankyrin repeat [Fusarium phyllophilum]|uniref:Ankyrin repeat n=1 Tax=Fusarium phyllophilum TaxID=47803 RepID=A0A8H5K5Z7_9HYPO|nr:ankyrin repeat [Fusarium phyllophilum]
MADEGDLFGLYQLWPLKNDIYEAQNTKVDIIAVHGLNGKAFKTWTQDGKLWLADFLPLEIPYARIFTFGYDSRIAFTGSASRVDDHGRNLLERLMAKRRQFSEKRPLLFICHSLGGIVVKRALAIAHERSRRYNPITRDTFGIMFLGTPHRGSDVAFWGSLLAKLADVVTLGSIRTQVLEDLKRKSDMLGAICSQFVERSESLHRIFSVYERQRTKGVSGLVVEEDSAVIGLPNEVPISIEADHRSMCKFSDMKSEKYQMISDCIMEMVEDALDRAYTTQSPLRDQFLRSIKTLDPDEVLRNITRPSPGTCSWITETSVFRDWRDQSTARILWISGAPGVGKTTASRFLIEHLRRWLQKNRVSAGKESIVAFFFCASRQWLRNSDVQIAQSLLYQVLSHNNSLFRDNAEPHIVWRLLTTVFQRSPDLNFWILIDAIDELQDQSRFAFIRRLRHIVSDDLGQKLKFIICDRSSPNARGVLHSVAWLDIRRQDMVFEDIRQFINARLEDFCSSGAIPWQYQNLIEESLLEISEGNFLQVALAWSHFTAGVSYWSAQVIKSRLEGLRKLSGEAKAFYCSLLQKIPDDSQDVAKIGFTWVLGSRKPLSLSELQHAVAISTGQRTWSDLKNPLGFNFDAHFDQAFGYLLRVDPDLRVRFAHSTVKELLTADDSVSSTSDSGVISKYVVREADIDAEHAKRCITVLSFRDLVKFRDIAREAMADKMRDLFVMSLQGKDYLDSLDFSKYDDMDVIEGEPGVTERIGKAMLKLGQTELDDRTRGLFAYCVSYWNYHCHHGLSDPEVSKSLTEFALLRQSHYFLMVAMLLGLARYHRGPFWDSIDQFSRLPPMHFILKAGDYPNVLSDLLRRGEDINGADSRGWPPLLWALVEDRKECLEMILANHNTRMALTAHDVGHVLHLALEAAVDPTMILRLIADPRVELNAKSRKGWTALQWCLSRVSLQSVTFELLIRRNVDIYEQDCHGLNALDQVFDEGVSEQSALKLISRSDVPENWFEKARSFRHSNGLNYFDDDVPRTFIHRASSLRWYSVEDTILACHPFKAVFVDGDGFTLLERYAYHGMKKRVTQILKGLPSKTFQRSNDSGSKLLILCAQQGWEQLVNVLAYEFSVDDTSTDSSGRTIAHWASELGWISLSSLLISKSRTWLNKPAQDGKTALHVAAEYRNYTACKDLLQAGASHSIRDKSGKLPIHIAAEQGHREIVRMLLEGPTKDLRICEVDKEGRSLLHYVVMWHSDSFIRQCLTVLQPQVNTKDSKGRTPLHFACIFGNEPAVSVLLSVGLDPDKRDASSFTPLHHALMEGSVNCAQTLIRHGARYDLRDKFDRNIVLLALRSENTSTVEGLVRFLQSKHSASEIAREAGQVDRFGRSAFHYLCHWVDPARSDDDDDGLDEVVEEVDEDWEIDPAEAQQVLSPAEWLIKAFATIGVDINTRDHHKYTPLHASGRAGNLAAARALLRVPGIEVSPKDEDGFTPLDWASVNGYDEIAAAIEAHGGVHSTYWYMRLKPMYRSWQSGFEEDDEIEEDAGQLTTWNQFAKLCKRCTSLQLRSTTLDALSLRNPSTGERDQELQIDLEWGVTDVVDFLTRGFSQGVDKCDCCEFIHHVVSWWQFYGTSVDLFSAELVHVSLHYVFRLDETDKYGLKALRIWIRPGNEIDGEEFHIDCPITASTDHDMGMPLRLQPPLSHINNDTLSWMKSKLESCVLHDHVNPHKTFIPDRLIDVRGNRLRLVLTKDCQPRDAEIQRYIALTYCWGPEPHASKQLKTTNGNISHHQQQIAEFSLPQVIKDAVAVTRALSISFLWVDALCILQDDGSDWDKQCAVMERIYGNAYATVAAASSPNCEEGFVKRTDRILLPFETHSGRAHVFGIYSPLYSSDASEDIIISPWLERGWTLQERMSSTRLLIFSERNVHFKCKSFSESMGRERDQYEADFLMLDRLRIESGGTADIYKEWHDIISQVNPRCHQFTRETDLLPSIAGIAALFNSKLNDDYAAGLWKNSMHQSLCWAISAEKKLRYQDLLKRLKLPFPYIAPSWSWASQRKWFRFDLYNPGLSADCRPEFQNLNTTITLRGESVFGEVKYATLDISSKLIFFDPFKNQELKNKDKRMAHHAPGSEPSPSKTPPSQKPSEYVYDSNGDTRIILSTSIAQTFKWEADKIWIEEEKSKKAYCKWKKWEEKKGKTVEVSPPTTPPAPEESPVTTLISPGGITNRTTIDWGKVDFSDFSNVQYSRPEFSDADDTDPDCTDAGTNLDSTSLQTHDWEYGETRVPHLKMIEYRMLVSGKHLELASPIFKTMVTGPFAEGKADSSGFRLITASDWDPEAFEIVLTIMHGYNRDVPRSLSLEMLVKVATIVNYYDCLESVDLYTEIWLEGLSNLRAP